MAADLPVPRSSITSRSRRSSSGPKTPSTIGAKAVFEIPGPPTDGTIAPSDGRELSLCRYSSKKIGIVPAAGCARSSGTSTVPHVSVTPGGNGIGNGGQVTGVTTGAEAAARAGDGDAITNTAATIVTATAIARDGLTAQASSPTRPRRLSPASRPRSAERSTAKPLAPTLSCQQVSKCANRSARMPTSPWALSRTPAPGLTRVPAPDRCHLLGRAGSVKVVFACTFTRQLYRCGCPTVTDGPDGFCPSRTISQREQGRHPRR